MDELPEFGIFKIVAVISSKVYFVIAKYVTIQFEKNYLPLHAVTLSSVYDGLAYIAPSCNIYT